LKQQFPGYLEHVEGGDTISLSIHDVALQADAERLLLSVLEEPILAHHYETTALCKRCGQMLDITYHMAERGRVIVLEPRRDVVVMLVHKPTEINGVPPCGGAMRLMLDDHKLIYSVAQEEIIKPPRSGCVPPEKMEEYIRLLEWLVESVDGRYLPKRYITLVRMRKEGRSPRDMASITGQDIQSIYRTLERGDATMSRFCELVDGEDE